MVRQWGERFMNPVTPKAIFTGQFDCDRAHQQWLAAALERRKMKAPVRTSAESELSQLPKQLLNATTDTFKAVRGLGQLSHATELRTALGHVMHNIQVELTQDPGSLKKNAALIATVIHVITRVEEAYHSSNMATNDPRERQYNQEQSAMTYFREIIGVTTGFVLLKRLQGVFENKIRTHYQYQHQAIGRTGIGQNIKHALGLLNGNVHHSEIKRVPNALVTETALHRMHDSPLQMHLVQIGHALNDETLKTNWVISPMFWQRAYKMLWGKEAERLVNQALKSANSSERHELTQRLLKYEKNGLKLVQNQLPVYLGLIPSILISGFGIEYASLHYAPTVKKYMLGLMQFLHIIPQETSETSAPKKASDSSFNAGR
jgi:hypothetical protein